MVGQMMMWRATPRGWELRMGLGRCFGKKFPDTQCSRRSHEQTSQEPAPPPTAPAYPPRCARAAVIANIQLEVVEGRLTIRMGPPELLSQRRKYPTIFTPNDAGQTDSMIHPTSVNTYFVSSQPCLLGSGRTHHLHDYPCSPLPGPGTEPSKN
jgi:hypothetical protein